MKRAMDRASGSGVFARDPDAQLDMIELELSETVRERVAEQGATGWRMESSLREYANFTPVNFWFEYPIHKLDDGECHLKSMPTQGSAEAGRMKNKRCKTRNDANDDFRNAFDILCLDRDDVSMDDMCNYLEMSRSTIYNRVNQMDEAFYVKKKRIWRRKKPENNDSKQASDEP